MSNKRGAPTKPKHLKRETIAVSMPSWIVQQLRKRAKEEQVTVSRLVCDSIYPNMKLSASKPIMCQVCRQIIDFKERFLVMEKRLMLGKVNLLITVIRPKNVCNLCFDKVLN